MKKSITLILSILLSALMLFGCAKEDNSLKASALAGCWVNTSGYTAENQVVDKVIEFIDDENIAVYSYFDGGKSLYTYTVEGSTETSITILIDDDVKKPTEITFVGENNVEFKAASDGVTVNLTRVEQDEANKFIEAIDEYAEY